MNDDADDVRRGGTARIDQTPLSKSKLLGPKYAPYAGDASPKSEFRHVRATCEAPRGADARCLRPIRATVSDAAARTAAARSRPAAVATSARRSPAPFASS